MRRQQGGYLVFVAVLAPVMVGMGALAVDLGRLFVLRAEMQNAADAAAVAAAMELNGGFGAQSLAEAAARNLLRYNSRFAEMSQLLGENITLEYYCAIGSRYDPNTSEVNVFCGSPYGADGKSPATSDQNSHYVRVTLAPGEGLAYTLRLALLPVIGTLLGREDNLVSLSATAVGGRSFYMCDYPPLMLCNPFENTTLDFRDEMQAGDQIVLKQQGGNAWAPGNFGFLQADNSPGGGAPEVARLLADASGTGCRAPIVTTATGSMSNQTAAGVNTRFGVYNGPGSFRGNNAASQWPPAPNVIDYPRDQSWKAVDSRFGNGDWDRDSYFAAHHDSQGRTRPPGWFEMTRWEVYSWEVSSGLIPNAGIPSHSPAPAEPDRRSFHVAVVNCQAHGLSGSQTIPLLGPDGFAKIFLTERVGGAPNTDIYGEYVEWAGETSDEFHVDVQLYE